MTTDKSHAKDHRPDDGDANSNIPEAPDVPEGGIPDLEDDSGKSSSQEAQDEQDRQLESGEENPG